jgi:hypothetical protein
MQEPENGRDPLIDAGVGRIELKLGRIELMCFSTADPEMKRVS